MPDLVAVPVALLEAAVLSRGDHTISEESDTTRSQGDPSTALVSPVLVLGLTSTSPTQNSSIICILTPTGRIQQDYLERIQNLR